MQPNPTLLYPRNSLSSEAFGASSPNRVMASTFLPSDDVYTLDSMPSGLLDLNSENMAPTNWRLDSWGVPPVTDNYGVVMDSTFDSNIAPMMESDDSTADQEEMSSPAPSSPSSVETPPYNYDHIENDPLSTEEWYENGALDEDLSEEMSEDTTAEPHSDEPSSGSYSMPEPSVAFTSPSAMQTQSNAASASAAAAATPAKRRGRPRTKVSPASAASAAASSATGSRKRRAESVVPESLFGTKKSKGASANANIIDRLPSSISPAELQNMSSSDFDSYYSAVASKLPKGEIEVAKAQRRRIKNRESASNSRVRKQDNLADLEAQVQQLRDQNETLRQKSLSIQSEHRAMARELDTYKRLVREHLPPQFVPSFFASSSSSGVPASANTDVIHVTTRNGRSNRVLARDVSSAALMCIVLFAVIWGSSTVFPSSVLRDANVPLGFGPAQISFPLPDAPHLAPVASSALTNPSVPMATSRRNQAALAASAASAQKQLQAGPSDAAWLARVIREREDISIKRAAAPSSSSVKVEELDDETVVSGSRTASVVANAPASAANNAMLISTDEIKASNETMLNAHLGGTPLATSSSSAFTASTSSGASSSAAVVDTVASQWKQNTTYIKCDSMQQVVPPTGAQPAFDPNAPLFVSLWVNPSVIGDSSISTASKDPFNMDSLVQITCQIVNVEQLGFGVEQVAISPGSSLPSAPGLSLPAALATSSS